MLLSFNKVSFDVSDEQKQYAWACAKKSRASHDKKGFNGSLNDRYKGYLGETCFADVMGLKRPTVSYDDDKGSDFEISGKVIDVKTMLLSNPARLKYRNNLKASQFERETNTDIYVFANFVRNTNQIEFVGWIKKNYISANWKKLEGQICANGMFKAKCDMYEIPNASLEEFDHRSFANNLKLIS